MSNNQVVVVIRNKSLVEPPVKVNSPIQTSNSNENKVLATYQTAMIVLYAVSGVVLGLFFIVVITNIIKNRLNAPTPQTNQGQDPTSRPRRGIARSVLESFPVFFFTMGMKDDDNKKENDDLEKGKAKELESDIELETISSDVMKSAPQAEETKDKENSLDISSKSSDNTSETNNNNDDNSSKSSQESNPDLPKNPPIAHIKDSSRSRSISTASNISAALTNNKVQEGQLTCPICLDDFESGEELRLLPCQHRYHTLCIDPWLLDISPLCPMCKTDYTSWESEVNATQHNQDSSGSSSAELAGNSNYMTNNENRRDSSVASSISHNFPHFRWIKYLTAIRRRRRNRRSNRQSRIVELANNNNNNNNNLLSQQDNNVVGTVITD
ncbi:hypothetical protein C1645_63809 [Glomus cerebriforme]|uniref:RING-type domain-containing protein n=1 Tax=Glomus cerebriforme TaxID=658196 RepID=A0A397TBX2_9GLOM|nr:hypothetical protein C1645_63809 [Glomus cerebriforme]